MPPRRSSVGAGATHDDPPSADSDDDYGASWTPPARGRGSRGARGGRARGRGAARGRGRGRGGATAARSANNVEDDEVDELEDDRSESDSGETSSAQEPRPVSPELGVPLPPPPPTEPIANGASVAPLVRSSSLSLLSSPGSSRASMPPAYCLPSAQQEDPNTPRKPQASPSLFNGSAHRSLLDDEGDVAFASPSSAGTVRRPPPAAASAHSMADSLSELDSDVSDTDDRAAPASSQEPRASTSTASTPAPHDDDLLGPYQKKKRGRPPGSRNKQHKQPISRAQRAAAAASVAAAVALTKTARANAAPARSGDGTASGSGSGSTPRATRANVTLPPGYIEGVTSSRWPRARTKGDGESSGEGMEGSPMLDDEEGDEEEEDVKPRLVLTPKKADKKGKGRAVIRIDQDEDELDELDEAVTEVGETVAMSRETSLDGPPTPVQAPVARGGPGRPRGKGKRGKKEKVMPEPVERAKRRKFEPDAEAAGRVAAREAARLKFLHQLDDERRLVEGRTHPLLDLTYRQLEEEKAEKLAQLRTYQAEREKELGLLADARIRASWRQWAERKDTLRTQLYLENHKSLKDLIAEEKSFPFFREHPLFSNTHDLPPAPHFRGPIRDPSFVPRSLIHAGHYVEPPALNPVLDHDSWRLSASEIEADLALFYDIDDEPYQTAAPPPPIPPVGVGMYAYPPPYYYDPAAPPPHMPASYMSGYPPAGMPPAPYYPPPPHAGPIAYGAPPPPPAHAAPRTAPPPHPAPPGEPRAAPPPQQPQPTVHHSPPISRNPPPAHAAAQNAVKYPSAAHRKVEQPTAPAKLPPFNGFSSATAPSQRPPPVPLPAHGNSSQTHAPTYSHSHTHSHSSAHSHSHSHSHPHHHHRPQPSQTAGSPQLPSMSTSSSLSTASKPTLPSLMSSSFPTPSATSSSRLPLTTAAMPHAQPHPHARPQSHLPSRSPLPPHAPSPASSAHSAAPAPPTLPSLTHPRISPSVSAPKLPSLTHRSPPRVAPPLSASPPVPGSAPSLHLPSLFSGGTAAPGAGGHSRSRSPYGHGGMLDGGTGAGARGIGSLGPGLSLGFGPATGLPLPSWLNPLPKPSVGVAAPKGGAGAAGEATKKQEAGAGGPKLPPLHQPQPGQQQAPQPPRPYWA
ncbi:hypothetical protein JCM11251_001200 [Rhodosporidiobolus azoricus]